MRWIAVHRHQNFDDNMVDTNRVEGENGQLKSLGVRDLSLHAMPNGMCARVDDVLQRQKRTVQALVNGGHTVPPKVVEWMCDVKHRAKALREVNPSSTMAVDDGFLRSGRYRIKYNDDPD